MEKALKIKVKSSRIKSFKKHLEMEHPSTRGKITIVGKVKRKKTNPRQQVNEMLKYTPNFKKQAKNFTKPI